MLEKLARAADAIRTRFVHQDTQTFASAVPRVAFHSARTLTADRQSLFEGEPIEPAVFAQNHGLLPVFVHHADQMMRHTLGVDNGIRYLRDDQALTGFSCQFAEPPAFASAILLYIQEAFEDAWAFLPRNDQDNVMLDDLVRIFINDMRNRALDLRPSGPGASA